MSNVYSLLLDLLAKTPETRPPGLFGTVAGVSPLTIRVRGREISRGLFVPRGTRYTREDVGREAALIPCEEGFLVLFPVEGGGL